MSGIHYFPHSLVHQRLHLIHVGLADRLKWYRTWHEQAHVERIHWVALVLFVFVTIVLGSIGSRALAARTPRLLSLDLNIRTVPYEYGRSTRGNPLLAYTYGEGTHKVFVIGGLHGNERSSALLAADLANHLADHPQDIPSQSRVFVIPIANPDGFQRRLRTNTRRVDLNRNFGTSDWRRYGRGPGGRVSGGWAPFSEREADALRVFLERELPDVVVALHARGNLINPELHTPSKDLAKRIAGEAGYKYLEVWGSYPVTGSMTLWTVEKFGAASITWELSSYTNPDWARNGGAILTSLKP